MGSKPSQETGGTVGMVRWQRARRQPAGRVRGQPQQGAVVAVGGAGGVKAVCKRTIHQSSFGVLNYNIQRTKVAAVKRLRVLCA